MEIKIPNFKEKSELFAWLRENKDDIEYSKKSVLKFADGFGGTVIPLKSIEAKKETSNIEITEVKVRPIINTTMVRDSHKDVHINGLWKKSLQENTRIKHLQEHAMAFDKIISDKGDLKAYVKNYTWKELGFNYDGETEALVFDSTVKQSRNPVMFKEYKDGNVDNHSVGMRYVKMKFAMNSNEAEDTAYKEEYDKHIDNILNKEEVEKDGYFWAIYEAKVIEGSAVPLGSNSFTPTLSQKNEVIEDENEKKAKNELNAYKSFLNLKL